MLNHYLLMERSKIVASVLRIASQAEALLHVNSLRDNHRGYYSVLTAYHGRHGNQAQTTRLDLKRMKDVAKTVDVVVCHILHAIIRHRRRLLRIYK